MPLARGPVVVALAALGALGCGDALIDAGAAAAASVAARPVRPEPAALGAPVTASARSTFIAPSHADRIRALGLRAHPLAGAERPFYASDGFLPLAPPGPSDWLAVHPELGQRYDEFLATPRAQPSAERRRIHIVPLGEVPVTVRLDEVAAYLAEFFALEVVIDEPIDFSVKARSYDGHTQLDGAAVLDRLAARVPPDAALVLGLTAADVYPDDDWAFAYGLASYGKRVALVSTARLAPSGGPTERGRALHRRLLAIASHELGHALGVTHCTHYGCVMNGANHLAEVDGHPLALCPVDLRKLDRVLHFDHAARYRGLGRVLGRLGLEVDAAWLEARLAAVRLAAAAEPR